MADHAATFSAATREWFRSAFPEPTAAQLGAWESITAGAHTLVIAPTGSGKTLAAFLWAIDRLMDAGGTADAEPPRTRVLYISPLKALGVDVERNLRAPLTGVRHAADRLGLSARPVTVGVRSGDTPASERRRLATHPPDILITTPESLFLMLTSAARDTLRGVETVIVDEVHALASGKRGAHLAVSLERLDALLARPAQRIGLSATVRPPEEVARFLGGRAPVRIVAPPAPKRLDLHVVVPVDDMAEPPAPPEGTDPGRIGSIWPHVEEAIVDRVLEHRSTIVFVNSRRLAERLTAALNEIHEARLEAAAEETAGGGGARAGDGRATEPGGTPESGLGGSPGEDAEPVLARAHHGSVAKEKREAIEDDLKRGRLRCVVATSSLELGIDMGEVDLVIQVEAPPSVASGLQRIGRAGHRVGEVSRGLLFPKHRAGLVHATVASERMRDGLIEELAVPANPLDILAQQTVAALAMDRMQADDWFDTVRRSAPFATLPRSAFDATLDLLAGRYPSDAFAELRPRILWNRDTGELTGRPGAQRLAVTSGGTIPDRGAFGVFLAGAENTARGGTRVGELDEEMVYESRVGDVFALGATSWRIQEITHDRVLVVPAFGEPGRTPFWHGDAPGRPAELGQAVGAFLREIGTASADDAAARCAAAGLDANASANLTAYLAEQTRATGHLPTDRTLVVERVRDELGDWRIILHSPYGMNVHAPWALAVGARIRERHGHDGDCVASDDGIIVRVPDSDAEPPGADLFVFDPDEIEDAVIAQVGGSALFAARFRECAARALLLPRYRPDSRSPLWQQRQKASQLLEVARDYPSFPIILETMRECVRDVYDLPALTELFRRIAARRVRLVETTTSEPSPFARTLLFGYVASFMYEGDSPLAERRAAALTVDTALLADLLGRVELRELLDAAVIDRVADELQRRRPDRRMRADIEGVADLLRMLGPLTVEELAERLAPPGGPDADGSPDSADAPGSPGTAGSANTAAAVPATADTAVAARLADDLVAARRAIRVDLAGRAVVAAIEDAGRLRDALGIPVPRGVPVVFTDPVDDPLGDLIGRFARTHGPFRADDAARRFGLGTAVVRDTLARLAQAGRVVEGEFRPDAHGSEWCDADVLRRIRRLCLAELRHDVEPVEQVAFARFLPEWQHVGSRLRGVDGVLTVIEQLAGARIPASAWESLVLPARVADYSPAMLDELTAGGDVVWAGAGALPGADGWVSLHPADAAELTLAAATDHTPDDLQRRVLDTLAGGGGYFFRRLSDAVGSTDDDALTTALWDLVWAGLVTNDTFAPLRALTGARGAHRRRPTPPRSRLYRGRAYARPAPPAPGSAGTDAAGIARGRPALPRRVGAPAVAGRWSLLPTGTADATARAHAEATRLIERYGVVTRGAAVAEGVPGGFALAYRVLTGFEEAGRARRGYFVEGLGAAQFATAPVVDRLRAVQREQHDRRESGGGFEDSGRREDSGWRASEGRPESGVRPDQGSRRDGRDGAAARDRPEALVLAATDPANPYGAALPWPEAPDHEAPRGHRPGRKAGALVVLVDGALALYLERGGKTALAFTAGASELAAAARAVAATVASGRVGKLTVETVDGAPVHDTPLGDALAAAGFGATPRGLRMRG